jgi:hypothetical protein
MLTVLTDSTPKAVRPLSLLRPADRAGPSEQRSRMVKTQPTRLSSHSENACVGLQNRKTEKALIERALHGGKGAQELRKFATCGRRPCEAITHLCAQPRGRKVSDEFTVACTASTTAIRQRRDFDAQPLCHRRSPLCQGLYRGCTYITCRATRRRSRPMPCCRN